MQSILNFKKFFNSLKTRFELTAEDSYMAGIRKRKEKIPFFVSKIENENHQISIKTMWTFLCVLYLHRMFKTLTQNGQERLYTANKFSTGTEKQSFEM
jgi:hypothetical protein